MAKNKIINFKVEESVKYEFEEICSGNFSNPSQELYKFVRQYIAKHKSKPVFVSRKFPERN